MKNLLLIRISIVFTIILSLLLSLMSKVHTPNEFIDLAIQKGPIALLGGGFFGLFYFFIKKKETIEN